MKLTNRMKETLGLSMLISAATLVMTFVVLSCKKRSVIAALAALAAAEVAGGACLLARKKLKKAKGTTAPCEDELFTEEECREANARIRGVLGNRHDQEVAPRVLREIPRDEDATEADFQ